MVKNFILDTNVLVHDPYCISNFQDNNVIIPIMVVEELDSLKKREGMLGFHARSAAKEINKLREYGSLSEGVSLPGGGILKIELPCTCLNNTPYPLHLPSPFHISPSTSYRSYSYN